MNIIQKGDKILRARALEVEDHASSKIQNIIKKMADAMFAEPDGIGIAAPQIGISLRIFLVSNEVLNPKSLYVNQKDKKKPKERSETGFLTFINPKVKKLASKKTGDVEGCLSVRGVYGEVLRPEKITIEYSDEHGKTHVRGASGLLARAFQHEIDHLNGILFIDKAKGVKHYDIKQAS